MGEAERQVWIFYIRRWSVLDHYGIVCGRRFYTGRIQHRSREGKRARRQRTKMGINVSKTLSTSPSFTTACDAVYDQCLDLAQHAFPGIRPYQLPHAAVLLHASFISSSSVPLISRWVPSPPDQAQVDWALRKTKMESEESLTREEFREFAVELFRFEILKGVEGMLVSRVPIGIAAIAGIGVVGKLGSGVVGSVAGVYALGVAASVYLGLT